MSELLWQKDMMGDNCFNVKLTGGHSVANVGYGVDEAGKWMTIYLIQTEAKFRRQGEATRLVEALKEYCAERGVRLAAWCPMNERSEGLFKKTGVEIV